MYITVKKDTKEIIAQSIKPFVSWSDNLDMFQVDYVPYKEGYYYTYENGEFIEHKCSEPIDNRTYEEKVVDFIREKYSLDEELAIQRQRDTKPEEFAEYFEYCEECKQKAKENI